MLMPKIIGELFKPKTGNSKYLNLKKIFFLRVVLPPLVPFVLLGIIGFIQLQGLVTGSLVGQIGRSAETAAAKLEREFTIRKTILERTGEDIVNIRSEFARDRNQLDKDRDGCLGLLDEASESPFGGIDLSNVISSDEGYCDPFLSEFAKVSTGREEATLSTLKNAVAKGYRAQRTDLDNGEQDKIQERFNSFDQFFPETIYLSVLKGSATSYEYGKVGKGSNKAKSIIDASGEGVKPAQSNNRKLIVYKYKLNNGFSIASVADREHREFIVSAIETIPLFSQYDQLIITDNNGTIIYPVQLEADKNEGKLKSNSPLGSANQYQYAGQDYLAQNYPIDILKWQVVSSSPRHIVLGSAQNSLNISLLALVLSLAASLALGYWFVRSATQAIRKLEEGSRVFAEGKFDQSIEMPKSSSLELVQLADTLNVMAQKIKLAEEEKEAKSKEFIHITSHELKAPITAILGNLSLITKDGIGQVDEKASQIVDQAYEGTERLRNLVLELLDIARLEAGKTELNIEPLDLRSEVNNAIKMQNVLAEEKNIEIIYQPPADLPKVKADKAKLQIILTNLISNAIKYNKTGGKVEVTHKLIGSMLATSVRDTGHGIPKDQQKHIFEKFFRDSSAKSSGVPGTGLGMHITKRFVEIMGGLIDFESGEGKGTVFNFTLLIEE